MANYDFSTFQSVMAGIKLDPNAQNLLALKNELNKFFKDSKCIEVLYTVNTDKMFFGMMVFPVIKREYLSSCIQGTAERFEKYFLELDSKLFKMNLTTRELVAIVLHEVGHIVNNANISKELSDILAVDFNSNGVEINYKELEKRAAFVNLGLLSAIHKITSFFHINDEEYIADNFVVQCGYGPDLMTAYDKIITSRDALSKTASKKPRIVVLLWTLSVYNNLSFRKRQILDDLKTQDQMEGSQLMKRAFDGAIDTVRNSINKITESSYIPTYMLNEFNIFDKIKFSSIKDIESELFEYNVRVKQLDNETEAMDVLRSLNFRISLIQEYIAATELKPQEVERLSKICDKFKSLRDELVRTATYKDKTYGLFVEYPEIKTFRAGY